MRPFFAMPSFSQTLWTTIADAAWPAIRAHPFLAGLVDGTLPEPCFRHYVEQDSLYLREFGRVLAVLAAKAETAEDFLMFCEHARNTLLVERALHAEFLSMWPRAADAPPPPVDDACLLYSSYLARTAWERPYAEGVAAVLPCYWIYLEVGRALAPLGSPNPLYQKWIDTYAGDAFAKVVAELLEVVNRIGAAAPAREQAAMRDHFIRGVGFEHGFWEMAWRVLMTND
jgi:thiaminase/transcriptional activator TenA